MSAQERFQRINKARTPVEDEEERWQHNHVQVGSTDYMRVKKAFSTGPVTMNPSRKATPSTPGKKKKTQGKTPKTKKQKQKLVDDVFGKPTDKNYDDHNDDDEEDQGEIDLDALLAAGMGDY